MRGSKPAGFSGVGERAARSLDRVSRRRGPRRAAGASLEQRDLLDDVRRVREHSRGNDAGEVVGEVVRRVEAAVGGAVAPTPLCWDYNPPRSPTRVTPQKSRATAGDKTRFLVFAHFQNHPKPPKTVTSVTPRYA